MAEMRSVQRDYHHLRETDKRVAEWEHPDMTEEFQEMADWMNEHNARMEERRKQGKPVLVDEGNSPQLQAWVEKGFTVPSPTKTLKRVFKIYALARAVTRTSSFSPRAMNKVLEIF